MIEGVFGFFDETESGKSYRFLSNFWYVDVVFDGVVYPSVEHAYQAAKTLSPIHRDIIRNLRTPALAKQKGKHVDLREDWEEIKVAVMRNLLEQKFQNPELRQKLLDTGDLYLEETNHWSDTFWGVCNGKGKNVLGNILMDIRSRINANQTKA